jgi:hypothetical protein
MESRPTGFLYLKEMETVGATVLQGTRSDVKRTVDCGNEDVSAGERNLKPEFFSLVPVSHPHTTYCTVYLFPLSIAA